MPDRLYFDWVRCLKCGLMRSDPTISNTLDELYGSSSFDYLNSIPMLQKTYITLVKSAIKQGKLFGSVLEIGGGNGFFLEAALNEGAIKVTGIEPSDKAINSASAKVRPYFIKSMMKPGLVPNNSIDIVTAFHVLDHLVDPLEVVKISIEALAGKGFFIAAVHNERSISAKIFKNKSPIFDVEHTFLFSKSTAIKLLELAGLKNVICKSYANTFSLAYLIQLIPIPNKIKIRILDSFLRRLLTQIKFKMYLGNIVVFGEK